MKAQRAIALAALLLLAGCGERTPEQSGAGGSTTPPYVPAEAGEPMAGERTPVRIGELGPNFAACSAAGTTRNLKAGEALPVRSAPFDNAEEAGSVPALARFFICARSHDQKWFGIVYDEDGSLAERCGVAEPVTRRRDYDGPSRSGWVQSAFVKVIAGGPAAPAVAETEGNSSTLPAP